MKNQNINDYFYFREDQERHIVVSENLLKIVHRLSDTEEDDEARTYLLRNRTGMTDYSINNRYIVLTNNTPKYKYRDNSLKGEIVCVGNHQVHKSYDEAIFSASNDIEVCRSDEDFALDIFPTTFPDIWISKFCINDIENTATSAPYGFIIKIYNGPEFNKKREIPDIRFQLLDDGSDIADMNYAVPVNGFHEFVSNSIAEDGRRNNIICAVTYDPNDESDLQNYGYSLYVEKATLIDLLYSEIVKKFGYNRYPLSDDNVITREYLQEFFRKHGKKKEFLVDLGGEGCFYADIDISELDVDETADGSDIESGVKDAINLNSQYHNSQLSSMNGNIDILIPRLILMDEKWQEKFPFGDRTIDSLFLQSVPLPLPSNDFSFEYSEIKRCIEYKGSISIWCVNEPGNENCDAEIAKKFIDRYKMHMNSSDGTCDASYFSDMLDNKYAEFYCGFSDMICSDDICSTHVPAFMLYQKETYLGYKDSIVLIFHFIIDED